ncbi:MAG TPA: M23 family metallopeptidase [Rhizomicrobium sp.]
MRANLMENANRRSAALVACVLCIAFLSGCETSPPTNGWAEANSWTHRGGDATYYTVVVHSGDTMSKIAARYDATSEDLARANSISAHATLHPGDVLHVPATRGAREAVLRDATNDRAAYAPATDRDRRIASEDPAIAPRAISEHDRVTVRPEPDITPHGQRITPTPRPHVAATAPQVVQSGERLSSYFGDGTFASPVSGRIIENFGDIGNGQRNDGINIAAPVGTPIRAAADGVVSYAGNELKSYGNLILIKHDGGYVTAYAHANSIGVARDQHVAKGDVIGTVGQTGDVDRPQLHFEVRQGMKPIDPRPLVMASSS